MSKKQYKFNPETLSYDPVKKRKRRFVGAIFVFLTATLLLSILYFYIYSYFFPSGQERVLQREIAQLESTLQRLEPSYQQINEVLTDIQQRDSNLYRALFESEMPPSPTIFQAGNHPENISPKDLASLNLQRASSILQQSRSNRDSLLTQKNTASDNQFSMLSRPFILPLANPDINATAAGYGIRMHPIFRQRRLHEGIDFTATAGTPVVATANGKVSNVELYKSLHGMTITIDHGKGYSTLYSHLGNIKVYKGENIKRGQVIGEVGNTGLSVAPHLHYEVRKNNKPVDPIPYFIAGISPLAYARIKELSNLGRAYD